MNKRKDNVIMRVYQPTKPFTDEHLPKKLISGVIDPTTKNQKVTPQPGDKEKK